jgi:hypothetical protein
LAELQRINRSTESVKPGGTNMERVFSFAAIRILQAFNADMFSEYISFKADLLLMKLAIEEAFTVYLY